MPFAFTHKLILKVSTEKWIKKKPWIFVTTLNWFGRFSSSTIMVYTIHPYGKQCLVANRRIYWLQENGINSSHVHRIQCGTDQGRNTIKWARLNCIVSVRNTYIQKTIFNWVITVSLSLTLLLYLYGGWWACIRWPTYSPRVGIHTQQMQKENWNTIHVLPAGWSLCVCLVVSCGCAIWCPLGHHFELLSAQCVQESHISPKTLTA